MFVEGGTCAIAQSEPASIFTAHRAVVPAIAWFLSLWPGLGFSLRFRSS